MGDERLTLPDSNTDWTAGRIILDSGRSQIPQEDGPERMLVSLGIVERPSDDPSGPRSLMAVEVTTGRVLTLTIADPTRYLQHPADPRGL